MPASRVRVVRRSLLLLAGAVVSVVGVTALALRAAEEPKRESVAAAQATADGRCFEMRTYHAAPGKLDALNARFRDHTTKLFKKHGMESIGYWTPVPKEPPAAAANGAAAPAAAAPAEAANAAAPNTATAASATGNGNGDDGGGTLIYLLAYPSREAATASWKSFREDPDWIKAKAESEKDGPLVEKVESVFLNPTDYSPMK